MQIHIAESKYWKTIGKRFQSDYALEITKAYDAATKLLPFGSEHINFFLQPRTYGLIKETHDTATTFNSEFITIAFDPKFAKSHPNQLIGQVPAAVYHEMNHAARFHKGIWHTSFLDQAILEGLATVFEREYTQSNPSWGKYPDNVKDWLIETYALGDSINRNHYMFTHPDGRKWIGYKIGTYIVDEAMNQSGKSITTLTELECSEIIALAKLDIG